MAGYDLSIDHLYGHVTTTKNRTEFLRFARFLRTLHPPEVRIALVLDNFNPHLSTKTDQRVANLTEATNVELAYTPTPRPGSTGSRPSSRHCATSLSTAPTTPATGSKPP